MGISFSQKGDWEKTEKWLRRNQHQSVMLESIFNKYGEQGVIALQNATPVKSGKTRDSWSYTIDKTDGHYKLAWTNSNVNNGVNIAIILQYGHGTRSGTYIQGIDYINPALKEIFQQMSLDIDKEVTSVYGE